MKHCLPWTLVVASPPPPPPQQHVAAAAAEAPEGERAVNAELEGELPPGWEELIDPSSGRKYYYNQAEGTASWERPVNESPNDGSAPDATADAVVRPEDDSSPNASAEAQGPYETEDMPQTLESPGTAELAADAKLDDTIAPGWSQAVDPVSGNTYYVNDLDGTTTWERPTISVDNGSDETQDPSAELSEQNPTATEMDEAETQQNEEARESVVEPEKEQAEEKCQLSRN